MRSNRPKSIALNRNSKLALKNSASEKYQLYKTKLKTWLNFRATDSLRTVIKSGFIDVKKFHHSSQKYIYEKALLLWNFSDDRLSILIKIGAFKAE